MEILEEDSIPVPPQDSSAWKTPMFEQYWSIRSTLPDDLLLFYRMGDFYELFGKDAVRAAPLLEIQLTARQKDSPTPIPMCGVPFHSWDSYAEKLLSRKKKIALCEQLSEPGKSKLVERGVVRILTPGLPVDYNRLDSNKAHYFVSLAKEKNIWQLQVVDFLAGHFYSGSLKTDEQLLDLLQKVQAEEILLPKNQSLKEGELNDWLSKRTDRLSFEAGDKSRENLWSYLEWTQRRPREELLRLLGQPKPLEELSAKAGKAYALTPHTVLEQWSVFPELFEVLNDCGSAVGARCLRQILAKPLCSVERIHNRQKLLQELEAPAKEIKKRASSVYDIERLLGRFRISVAAPKELLRLLRSLLALDSVFQKAPLKSEAWKNFIKDESLASLKDFEGELQSLQNKLSKALDLGVDVQRARDLKSLLRRGFDEELDRLIEVDQNASAWLERYESKLRSELGIPNLKLRYNRVFSYYIEVSKAQKSKVPDTFERRQTMVNAERYSSPELKKREEEILTAATKTEDRAKEIFEELQKEVLKKDQALRAAIDFFAHIDAFSAVNLAQAKLRRFGPWTFPKISGKRFHFEIHEGRHPLVELMQDNFVSNSLKLEPKKRLLLLTGPNMAGKSTLMRQAGLALLLAQCGFRVPAHSMNFYPSSGFFSRMGASDRILEGESTFMVEMREMADIIRQADENAFLLIDELGRGTSTQDGLAIAKSLLEFLHDRLKAITIFATHYHELSDEVSRFEAAFNGSMGIREWKDKIVFLRNLVEKPATSSYGIYVAKLAGLPPELLKKAEKNFEDLEGGKIHQLTLFSTPKFCPPPKPEAQGLEELQEKALPNPIEERLGALDVDDLSPREAWKILLELKDSLENRKSKPREA